MNEYQTEQIKLMIAEKIKLLKGETAYTALSAKCNLTAARISDAANNKIDCRLSTLIEIATALRIHPKELLNIAFDFEEYYAELDR